MLLNQLIETIKDRCPQRTWSQGNKLAENNAVTGETSSDDEIVLRVKSPNKTIPLTVVLYPKNKEWDCNCASKSVTCAHVAAAAIALESGGYAPAWGKIAYKFVRKTGALALHRQTTTESRETVVLAASLGAILSGRSVGPELVPEQIDLQIDHLLGPQIDGRIPSGKVVEIFALLESSSNTAVFLNEEQVAISTDPVVPLASVEDTKDDVVLRLDRDPGIDEVLGPGIVLCGDTICPMGEMELTGKRLENLPAIVSYGSRIGDLVTGIIPALRKRIPVAIQSERLPETTEKIAPRIVMDVTHEDRKLSVTPKIVYGEPARARLEGNKLTHVAGAIPVRDLAQEKRLVFQLRDELNLAPDRTVTFERGDAIKFANKLQEWQDGKNRVSRAKFHSQAALVPNLDIDGDDFSLDFDIPPPFEGKDNRRKRKIDARTVLNAWRDGLDLVPLQGGGWAPLPVSWLNKHGDRVANLLEAREPSGKVKTFAIPELAQLASELNFPEPPSMGRLKPLIEGFVSLPDTPLPKGLKAELRDYQLVGYNWLSFLRQAELGAILADDMGLGKTLQTLCAIRGKTLVVSPRSVLHNWRAEIEKFRPDLTSMIYHGPKRSLSPTAQITLTTYALLRIDAKKLSTVDWDMLVLDEAQAIKNPDSQVARAAYQVKAKFRVALSGTPVENRLEELWSQVHFTNRGLLGGRRDFLEAYSRPINRGEKGAAKKLRDKIRPFVLRRIKRDVAPELPPRTDMVLHCELTKEERLVYDTIRAATQKEVVQKLQEGGSVLAALEALLRLRQAACHSALVPGQSADSSSKVKLLCETIEQATSEGHKCLVFSQWTSFLNKMEPHLKEHNITYTRLDGQTRNREKVVNEFQDPNGPSIMLVSLKAGGTGLNLTAADHVFLCDPWWNPAVEDQAADRAHRIGQDKPVMVYKLVALETVEERILQLQDKKRQIADAALGEAGQAASLTRDDLLALLA